MDAFKFMHKFTFHKDNSVTIEGNYDFNVFSPVTLPNTFWSIYGKLFTNQWFDTVKKLVGHPSENPKSTFMKKRVLGYGNTPYEKTIKEN